MSDQCSCKVSGWMVQRREETDEREEQMRKIGGDMEWVQQGC